MKKCVYCNASLEDNAVKCEYCGQEPDGIQGIQSTVENKPMPKKRRRKNSVWSVILCVFLSIGIFLTCLAGSAFVLLGNAVNGKTIETVVEKTDILSIPVGDGTVIDKVEEVFKNSGNETLAAMSAEEIRALAEQAGLNQALSGLLDQAAGYLTGEYEDISVSADQIMVIIEDNIENIYEATGYRITEEDLKTIREALTEHTEEINQAATEMMTDPVMQTTVSTVRFAVGPTVPAVTFGIAGGFLIIVLLILRRKEGTFLCAGIPALLIGILYFVVYGASSSIKALLFSYVSMSATVTNIAETVISVILTPILYTAIICAAVGIVCIVLYVVIHVIIGKSKKYAK